MKIKTFIEQWVNKTNDTMHIGNITACEDKLFSYNTCICQRDKDCYVVNITKYSRTTSRHQKCLLASLAKHIPTDRIRIVSKIERNTNEII